jgi:hypothetical protein
MSRHLFCFVMVTAMASAENAEVRGRAVDPNSSTAAKGVGPVDTDRGELREV